ncbi:uncharacterized protein LOC127792224 isoform X2 [Diospyros lotus]|uniref:uncharacterized protein LOC127792224 isoform X2 n=1 Tax=Diospyros lotus TaxID=55363 RepID=UPI00225A8967|nr:uncharacterized protein LOC127792224 isoform X2 [Diospyros lotus]
MVTCSKQSVEEEKHVEEELKKVESSIAILNTDLEQLALERHASDLQSHCDSKASKLQADVNELENVMFCGKDGKNFSDCLDSSLHNSLERLNSAKRELAIKLREIVWLKRQLDDVPSQAELIQYEHRFSELDVQIQEKLRKTRKYYATFNALLEIKDLMLKETSLLNSISSQFQGAISSTAGRMKLIDSMEGILTGTQQKLEKVQLTLQAEQKICDAVKERYATAIAEQRSCYSILKDFQEECAKNERLRRLSS